MNGFNVGPVLFSADLFLAVKSRRRVQDKRAPADLFQSQGNSSPQLLCILVWPRNTGVYVTTSGFCQFCLYTKSKYSKTTDLDCFLMDALYHWNRMLISCFWVCEPKILKFTLKSVWLQCTVEQTWKYVFPDFSSRLFENTSAEKLKLTWNDRMRRRLEKNRTF